MENRFRFRVWDKENKNFLVKKKVNKAYDIDGNRLPVIIYSAPDFYSENTLEYCMECDGFIVMQSTGLSDKNGKLIFEGDILDNKDCSDSKVKVVFLFPSNENGYRYGFYLENLDTHSIREFFVPDIDLNKLEIIGNIYENKELLGE